MYIIQATCFDPPYTNPPYPDQVKKEFERKCEAQEALMQCLLSEIETLNQPDARYTPRTDIFLPCLNYEDHGKKYDGAVLMWDGKRGIKERPITLYEIVWVNNDELDKWNLRLRERFGENITFGLKSEIVDEYDDEDGNLVVVKKYYYEGLVTGKSELYDTIEKAYEEAKWFMDNIELFVDE